MHYFVCSVLRVSHFKASSLLIYSTEGNNEEYLAYDKPDSFSSVAQVYYKYHQKPGLLVNYCFLIIQVLNFIAKDCLPFRNGF